jgi:geranylgeranylglycerol-phosphate geranylgeranyltransferase
LIRVINCLLAGVGVYIGAALTWLVPVYYPPLYSALAAFFVCAGGNVINDICDINTDRINHPERILVQKKLTTKTAWLVYAASNLSALLLGWAVSQPVLLTVIIAIVLLAAYSLWLKGVVLIGNVLISLLAGLTFITGGIAVDTKLAFILPGPLVPAVFAFLFHLVREILKDVEDIEGDRAVATQTLPQVIGVSNALTISLVLFFILTLLTYIPVFKGWFGTSYEILVVYLTDIPLLALLIFIWGNPTKRLLRIGSLALKFGMLLGLIALVSA